MTSVPIGTQSFYSIWMPNTKIDTIIEAKISTYSTLKVIAKDCYLYLFLKPYDYI